MSPYSDFFLSKFFGGAEDQDAAPLAMPALPLSQEAGVCARVIAASAAAQEREGAGREDAHPTRKTMTSYPSGSHHMKLDGDPTAGDGSREAEAAGLWGGSGRAVAAHERGDAAPEGEEAAAAARRWAARRASS